MIDLSTILLAHADGSPSMLLRLLEIPAVWATAALALGLWCLIPQGRKIGWLSGIGWLLVIAAVGLFGAQVPLLTQLSVATVFWLLASLTVASAVAMITSRSPVYSAIWFALSLLGTSALFLLNGAQFIGIATVAVYAGAIVVMFLFLIMLAQPDGFEYYDRITWSRAATMIATVSGALVVLMLTMTFEKTTPPASQQRAASVANTLEEINVGAEEPQLTSENVASVQIVDDNQGLKSVRVYLKPNVPTPPMALQTRWHQSVNRNLFAEQLPPAQFVVVSTEADQVASPFHVASLGNALFSEHLISVEIAGTLLLVALVGAVAICIRGREQENQSPNG